MLACRDASNKADTAALQQKMDRLEGKIVQLEKDQKALLDNQERSRTEILKAIDEVRPGIAEFRQLQESQREKDALESPVEKIRRAMSEVRSIATAAQSYATDSNLFPEKNQTAPIRLGDLRLCKVTDIARQLSPDYIRSVPAYDPWGHPYLYWASDKRDHFLVLSTGEDGQIDEPPKAADLIQGILKNSYAASPIESPCYEGDIIWFDDGYIQRPSGPMKRCKK